MLLRAKQPVAALLLVLWLLANWSGLHSHFCFDGQEPAATVKFELGADLHAETDQQHVDVDDEPTKTALVKLLKLDNGLLLAALLWVLFAPQRTAPSPQHRNPAFAQAAAALRPPLRAPPVISALAI